MSLVATAGKHSLVRGRKKPKRKQSPRGTCWFLGCAGSTGQAQAGAAECPCVAMGPECSRSQDRGAISPVLWCSSAGTGVPSALSYGAPVQGQECHQPRGRVPA